MKPYTTEGIPTSNSITGCKIFCPCFGEISTIKTAAPIANGVATIADKNVTKKEPIIIGNAPTSGCPFSPTWLGFHFVPNKKSKKFTLSTKNVAKPLLATK